MNRIDFRTSVYYNRAMDIRKLRTDCAFLPKSYYKKSFDRSFDMWYHTHDYLEIMYCNSGNFIFSTLGKDKKVNYTKEVKRGDIVVIFGDVYHKIEVDAAANASNIELEISPRDSSSMHIDFHALLQCFPTLKEMFSLPEGFIILPDISNFSKTFNLLVKYADVHDLNESLCMQQCLLYQTFLELIPCYKNFIQKNVGVIYLKKALDYINLHLNENISVCEIARLSGVSKSYLERLFKQRFKKTILRYIMDKKIEFIKFALLNTNDPVEDLRKRYGFNSKTQLVYEFKRRENCTPIQFRTFNRNKNFTGTQDDYLENSFQG